MIAGRIFAATYAHVEQRALGVCFPDNTGFLLPGLEDTVRSPDAAFVARDRLPAEGFGAGWVRAAPNVVVEIVSPNEGSADLDARLKDYFSAGTELVWVIHPELHRVVSSTMRESRVYSSTGILDGGTVLPGFRIAVASLFAGLGG